MRSYATAAAIVLFNLAVGGVIGGPAIGGFPGMVVLAAVAIAINLLGFAPSAWARSDRFYDLLGSVTFLTLMATALVHRAPSARSLVVAAVVCVWTTRLGLFLFARIQRNGHDTRFDTIKLDPGRFLVAWMLQATWAFCVSLPALMLVMTPAPLGPLDGLGWLLWSAGFAIEVTADRQKSAFRADPEHQGRFITSGLWAWSRHPNYFGEILLWTGLWISGLGLWSGAGWLTVLSPLLTFTLLTRISGIPLLERRAMERWGDDPAYQAYLERTPALVPRPPRR